MTYPLRQIRMMKKMTQEDLAEKMNVSRQSIAKWESGESVPDIVRCGELARILELDIQDILELFDPSAARQTPGRSPHQHNKFVFGVSKIRSGSILLPLDALKAFRLQEGDELIVLGDLNQGLALIPKKEFDQLTEIIQGFTPQEGETT